MICQYCKKEIAEFQTYCPHCGQAINNAIGNHKESESFWENANIEKQKLVDKAKLEATMLSERNKKRKRLILIAMFSCILVVALIYYATVIYPMNQYKDAQLLLQEGKYQDALDIFSNLNKEYEGLNDFIEECNNGITENNYNTALNTFKKNDYSIAMEQFKNLNGYKDSEQYIMECELMLLSAAKTRDKVSFGKYKWIVLENNTSDILLVSDTFVDKRLANEYAGSGNGKYRCWSQSTLRRWLNGTFISDSFSSEESKHLMVNRISTPEYNVDGYNGWDEEEIDVATEDKVYIPSKDDVEKYRIRPVPPPDTYSYNDDNENPGWLRDRGHGIAFQSTLNSDGSYGSEWHHWRNILFCNCSSDI